MAPGFAATTVTHRFMQRRRCRFAALWNLALVFPRCALVLDEDTERIERKSTAYFSCHVRARTA
jgi:hypothetical protein